MTFKIKDTFSNEPADCFPESTIKTILQIKASGTHTTQDIPKTVIIGSPENFPLRKQKVNSEQTRYGKAAAGINSNFFITYAFLNTSVEKHWNPVNPCFSAIS